MKVEYYIVGEGNTFSSLKEAKTWVLETYSNLTDEDIEELEELLITGVNHNESVSYTGIRVENNKIVFGRTFKS